VKFSEHPSPVKGTTFKQRRDAFLRQLERYSSRLDLETVWEILRTVKKATPEAFNAFVTSKGDSARSLRRQYVRQNKPRLDAECYADFLYAVYRWQARGEGLDPIQIAARKQRALARHGKWQKMGFKRDAWWGAENERRKRRGLAPLERTEFRRLELLYDKDSVAGKRFRGLVGSILKNEELPMTPFHYEELVQMLAQVDDDESPGLVIFGDRDGRLY
jgi:hypothetical protein